MSKKAKQYQEAKEQYPSGSIVAEKRVVAPKSNVHFSSAKDLWATPPAFFRKLDEEFNFTLDVCALAENAKCPSYFTPAQDGLKQLWQGTCWMNPPYGRQIAKWIRKAHLSSLDGATVVCLIPSRTDTIWWHDYVMKGEVRLLRGRLKFGDSRNSAPFPSAVVVFRPQVSDQAANR